MIEDNFFKTAFFTYKNLYTEDKIRFYLYAFISACFVFLLFFHILVLRPSKSFPVNEIIAIEDGQSLTQVSIILKQKNVIRSDFWFKNMVIFFGRERSIKSGDYIFPKKQGMLGIIGEITKDNSDKLAPLKIVIREGLNIFEIADIFSFYFENFDRESFLNKAKEGYLFPDTYYFARNTSVEKIISIMEENFKLKTKALTANLENSSRSFYEIITMASILETEANSTEDRKVISGILWNRVDIGMPLQVDVSFKYINGKNSHDLTIEDLAIDSPYNSYVYRGLPPTPISNPSLDAIAAAMYPAKTDYIYFLHDKKGNIYYGSNFEEHKKNRELYLD